MTWIVEGLLIMAIAIMLISIVIKAVAFFNGD